MDTESETLQTKRRRARVSGREVAAKLGISNAALSNFETGKSPLPFKLTEEDYQAAFEAARSGMEVFEPPVHPLPRPVATPFEAVS